MEQGRCTDSYEDRNKGTINLAEELFKEYCRNKGYKIYRLGLNEKEIRIDNYMFMHPFIRNLPDFIVENGNKLFYIDAKGTNKVKLDNIKHYKEFQDLYCLGNQQVAIAFCFRDKTPIIVPIYKIDGISKKLEIFHYPDNNKEYVNIPLDKLTHK